MKWERDRGVVELIEYFDQDGVAPDRESPGTTGWARLVQHPDELAIVNSEIQRCREDFPRAARNYFWLTDKNRMDIPFKLWESQELIYERIRQMREAGRPQKLMILKARQLGCSSLIEALIAWRVMFFKNVNAIVVSKTPTHSAYLFRIMLHIYEMMPWWLKPMARSIKIEEGLIFDNPDLEDSRFRPGLKSMVQVQAANQLSGVGEGIQVSAAHISEIGDFGDKAAREIIEGDLGHALSENKETFAIIESTAKGAGTYFHRLWKKNVELAEDAGWEPLFLPWFFEKGRRRPVRGGWEPQPEEEALKSRVAQEWVKCDNPHCGYMRETVAAHRNYTGATCNTCQSGTFRPYILQNDQLYWLWWNKKNAAKDIESLKELKQEMCSTAEEAFQISGIQVFPQEVFDWVASTISRPAVVGMIDKNGDIHGIQTIDGRCPHRGCEIDHSFHDLPLRIWEMPREGYEYCIGVDVAEGLGGEGDFSVAVVNKKGKLGERDEQVAVFRSNTINPVEFAYPVGYLGKMYNEAMLAIEINRFDSTYSQVRFQLQYPNLYRWKHLDATNVNSNRWGWWTDIKSKPRLYQTAKHWLKSRMWVVRSHNLYEELQTFNKEDYDTAGAKAAGASNDDEVMAAMIALYCSHDTDWDENLQMIPARRVVMDANSAPWKMICMSCDAVWGTESAQVGIRCRSCGSPRVRGEQNVKPTFGGTDEIWKEFDSSPERHLEIDYSLL